MAKESVEIARDKAAYIVNNNLDIPWQDPGTSSIHHQ